MDLLTAWRIAPPRQRQARLAICRHVRGSDQIGPRFRRGSNSWRPNDMETLLNPELEITPCPNCGAGGEALEGVDGRERCPSCAFEWVVGDYDWTVLGDVLRYQQDAANGLIDRAEDQRCHGCDRLLLDIYNEALPNLVVRCDRDHCRLLYDKVVHDAHALVEGEARRLGRLGAIRTAGANAPSPPIERTGLVEVLSRIEASFAELQEGDTPYDARQRTFEAALESAKERDRRRALQGDL